jgi:outer membrane protein assembly factor BamB
MKVPMDQWNQFGGNPAGSGFRAVNSKVPAAASWRVELPKPTGTGSPVLGPDGTIYIGTFDGNLVAVRPDGQVKWTTAIATRNFDVVTPAVAEDSTVYCLCTNRTIVRDHREQPVVRDHRANPPPPELPTPAPNSFLVRVDPDGRQRWKVPIRPQAGEFGIVNGTIAGAPRIVSRGNQARIVFVVRYAVPIRYDDDFRGPLFVCHLAVVDEGGTFRLFNRYEEEKIFIDAHGGGGFGSATVGSPPDLPGPKLRNARPCADTPVVFGAFPTDPTLTIIASGDTGLYALRWNDREGALAGQPQKFKPATFPSPAAFPNGLLTGTSGTRVTLLDADTLTPHVAEPTQLSRFATVAGGLRQMYFSQRQGTLIAMDSNGAVWKRTQLGADTVAFPALSANHVHVATATGLRTLTLDLQDVASVDLPGAGFSSPAIGPDGSVYVAAGSTLFAFTGQAPRVVVGRLFEARRPARPE